MTYNPWEVYGIVMVLHVVVAAVIFVVQGGVRARNTAPALRERVPAAVGAGDGTSDGDVTATRPSDNGTDSPPAQTSANDDLDVHFLKTSPAQRSYRTASLLSLLAFVLVTVMFKLDVGLTAIALAFLLQIAFRPSEAEMIKKVPWTVVLLLSGLVIYLNLLDILGTLDSIEHVLGGIGSPLLLILVVAYVTSIISNMESSTLAVLGVMVPVALSVAGGSGISVTAVLVAVVMSAAVVVMSPLHIAGALIISDTPNNDQDSVFRRLLIWSAVLTAIVPGVVCLYPILLG